MTIFIEIPHQRDAQVMDMDMREYLNFAAQSDGAPSQQKYRDINEAANIWGHDLPDDLAAILQDGNEAVEHVENGQSEYYPLGSEPSIDEALLDFAKHDLHSLHVFADLTEAQKWADGYIGHQWVKVRAKISMMTDKN